MTRNRVEKLVEAHGWPGVPPRWTSGGKEGTGTSRSDSCPVWFTIGAGHLNEVYYPRIDSPCTRNLFLVLTGPDGYYSDERQDVSYEISWIAPGVPGYRIVSRSRDGRYRIEKTIVTDDRLAAVVQRTSLAISNVGDDFRLFVYLNPHIGGQGAGNTGWIGDFKGRTILLAERGGLALALCASSGFRGASAGFVGKSDGLDDLKSNGRLVSRYLRARNGNVALVGEIDLSAGEELTLALGFGEEAGEAAHCATGALLHDFEQTTRTYTRRWTEWQQSLEPLDGDVGEWRDLYHESTAALLSHTNKSIPGAVASLAISWGDHRGDEDLLQGVYHLVWSRDLIGERAHYEIACGNIDAARRPVGTMANYASDTGMLSEQVWDSDDIPEKGLFLGRPTGSAMPLLWAHAEYIKLKRSLRKGTVFDQPCRESNHEPENVEVIAPATWRSDHPLSTIPAGTSLRILSRPGESVSCHVDDRLYEWPNVPEVFCGLEVRDLPSSVLHPGACVTITVTDAGRGTSHVASYNLVVERRTTPALR